MNNEVWWRGRQWIVDQDGMSCPEHNYNIFPDKIAEKWWDHPELPFCPIHVGKKGWCDLEDFLTAFLIALTLHGHGDKFTSENLQRVMSIAREQNAYIDEHSRHFKDVCIEKSIDANGSILSAEFCDVSDEATRRMSMSHPYRED